MKGVKLYDQYGYPVAPFGTGRLFEEVLNRKPLPKQVASDTDRLVTDRDWRELMMRGRVLHALSPMVQGATSEQGTYSFPLQARYEGADKEWGDLAEDAVANWRENPTILGPPFDGTTLARLSLSAYIVDGDVFRFKVFDESGYPRLQPCRAHRVGSRLNVGSNYILDSGPYKGKRICNGAVLDSLNRRVAFRVLADTPDNDTYVSAADAGQMYDPLYLDEFRGISKLAVSIRTFGDIKRLKEWELTAMQGQSAHVLTERNETGMIDEAAEAIAGSDRTDPTAIAKPDILDLDEGTMKFVKAGTGQGLEFHTPNRPGENWQSFTERMSGDALYGMEWPENFARMIKEPGGAWARIELQKVNRRVLKNASIEARAQKSEDIWFLSWLIAQKLLRAPSDGDIFSWKYHLALPQLTADSGNEEAAKREAYVLGLTTLLSVTSPQGLWWENVRSQREGEIRDKFTRVRVLAKEFADLEFSNQEIANEFEQKNPNGAGQQDNGIDADLTEVKTSLDAYGVAVRAGAITPNDEDEAHFRGKLSLPVSNKNVARSWVDDKGVRRPITIAPNEKTPGRGAQGGNKSGGNGDSENS